MGRSPFRWSFGDVQETADGEGLPPSLGQEATSASGNLRLGALLSGRYRVEGVLGEGGVGRVYRAEDEVAGRQVAIKVLQQVSPAQRARFQREGELTAALQHPGIVKVHGGGVDERGVAFLVMERVEGARSLGDAAREERDGGLSLLLEVALGVAHAHERGVVHRDLKPDNVLVDASGRARVCDFGMAWREDVERLTQTGQMLGTPVYMPPERFSGRQDPTLGKAGDVWSLGVMLYATLTGELPFEATGTLAEFLARVARSEVTPPRKIDPGISPQLEEVCLRSLEKQAQDRYPDAGAFAEALEAAMDGAGGPPPWAAWLALVGGGLAGGLILLAVFVTREPRVEVKTQPAPAPAPAVETQEPREETDVERAKYLLDEVSFRAHELTGYRPQVEEQFSRARALAAGDPDLQGRIELERLAYLFRRGRWGRVLSEARSLEGSPGFLGASAGYLRGLTLYELTRTDEARRVFEETFARASGRPSEPMDLVVGAWARVLGDGDMAAALELAERALQEEPQNVPALLAKTVALGRSLRLGEAKELRRRVEALAPDHPTVHRLRVGEAVRAGNLADARRMVEGLILLLEPDPPAPVLGSYGQVLFNRGQPGEARRAFERALGQDPTAFQWRLWRALSFHREGHPERATYELRQLREEDPAGFYQRIEASESPRLRDFVQRVLRGG